MESNFYFLFYMISAAPINSMMRASASFLELGRPLQNNDDRGQSDESPPPDLTNNKNLTKAGKGDAGKGADALLCQEIERPETPIVITGKSIESNEYNKTYKDPPARERPKNDIWPERDALSFTRSLMFYGTGAVTAEHEEACHSIIEARAMRAKYQGGGGTVLESLSDASKLSCKIVHGVFEIYDDAKKETNLVQVPDIEDFVKDYDRIVKIANSGAMRSFCYQRLQMLDTAFQMHVTANGAVENEAQSNLLGTDFYRTMKIDNHIHGAAAASANQFVNFVANKLETEGDTVVMENGQTLKEVFSSAGLSADHLTIDAFNVLADYSVYQRFDTFNAKYSPFRLAQIRKIFLKVENVIGGRFFVRIC